jgi:homoserine O-acetyltransferase
MSTITADRARNGGEYRDAHAMVEGLRRHARMWAVMGQCPDFYHAELLAADI